MKLLVESLLVEIAGREKVAPALGILPELFRAPVVRDGHQTLPRDLEEHHTPSYVKIYVKI